VRDRRRARGGMLVPGRRLERCTAADRRRGRAWGGCSGRYQAPDRCVDRRPDRRADQPVLRRRPRMSQRHGAARDHLLHRLLVRMSRRHPGQPGDGGRAVHRVGRQARPDRQRRRGDLHAHRDRRRDLDRPRAGGESDERVGGLVVEQRRDPANDFDGNESGYEQCAYSSTSTTWQDEVCSALLSRFTCRK
jgi:hypothetical protein